MRHAVVFIALVVVGICRAGLSISDPFVATDEFQEVKPGQAVPPGLHVRMDLEKGTKFAKKIDPRDAAGTALLVVDSPAEPTPSQRKPLAITTKVPKFDGRPLGAAMAPPSAPKATRAANEGGAVNRTAAAEEAARTETALKLSILRGLPQPEPELASALKRNLPQAELDRIVKLLWDKRQIELAAARDAMVSDVSRMQREIDALTNASASVDERVASLRNLEWLVADIDNAQDFAHIGGVETVVFLLAPQRDARVRINAAWVLGTAAKHIAKVQDAAVSAGALERLMAMLERSGGGGGGDGGSEATTPQLHAKAMYALGTLVRGNAAAQRRFEGAGGGEALRRAATRVSTGRRSAATKAAALAGDLLRERGGARALRAALLSHAWCATLTQRLRGAASDDEREKIVDAIGAAADAACGEGAGAEGRAASGAPCRAALAEDDALHGELTVLARRARAAYGEAPEDEKEFALEPWRTLDAVRERLKRCAAGKGGGEKAEL